VIPDTIYAEIETADTESVGGGHTTVLAYTNISATGNDRSHIVILGMVGLWPHSTARSERKGD
jgi:hypothetical protein